jgi:hypothetical protein
LRQQQSLVAELRGGTSDIAPRDDGGVRAVTSAPVNHAPTAAAQDQLAARGQVFNASDLFSASDGDGDALLYFFYDNSANPGSGYFTVNGVGLHPVPRTPS